MKRNKILENFNEDLSMRIFTVEHNGKMISFRVDREGDEEFPNGIGTHMLEAQYSNQDYHYCELLHRKAYCDSAFDSAHLLWESVKKLEDPTSQEEAIYRHLERML